MVEFVIRSTTLFSRFAKSTEITAVCHANVAGDSWLWFPARLVMEMLAIAITCSRRWATVAPPEQQLQQQQQQVPSYY